MLKSMRLAAGRRKTAADLAIGIVARARQPWFYRALNVPDTFNGRFDLVALHAFLVLDRLETGGERALAQELVNELFHSFEDALREQGAGDMGMTKRLQTIASAFYGRLENYRAAAGEGTLAAALLRNVYGENGARETDAQALAAYAAHAGAALTGLNNGNLDFGPLPEGAHERH